MIFRNVLLRTVRPDVVKKSDRRALPRIKEEVQEVRVTGSTPTTGANGMNEWKSEDIAIEFDRFPQPPCRPRRMVNTIKAQLDGVDACWLQLRGIHFLSPIVPIGRVGAISFRFFVKRGFRHFGFSGHMVEAARTPKPAATS